jgi:DNA-binding NtrC family response regulator
MAKILVLDDRPAICDLIQYGLIDAGHEVRTAYTGDQAIDLGYLFEPQILITDWDLKGEYDGLEVCEAIHHANNKIRMILMSGHSMDHLGDRFEQQYVFSMLEKPFCIEKLFDLVEQALTTSSGMPASFSVN